MACSSSNKGATPTPGMTMGPVTTATSSAVTTATPVAAATLAPSSVPKTASVTIKDFEFTPASITVAVGSTVTWTNDGPSTHTVTADDGSFDSKDLAKGGTFSQTFQTAGTFSYHCSIHPFMTAKVIVQ
jgi:plastocyanin